MRTTLAALLLATLFTPAAGLGQAPAAAPERGVYLTIFRSPASGAEFRSGHVGVHAGFYPTILGRNDQSGNVNFIRVGGSYYLRPSGSTIYVSPSLMISLDRNWKHGALTEVGFRGRLFRSLSGRVGGAVLTTTDGEVRVNPTIGMDVRLGGSR